MLNPKHIFVSSTGSEE